MTGPGAISGRKAMIAQMNPRLDEVHYAFIAITPEIAPQALGAAIGTFREDEGVSAIVPFELACELGRDGASEFARIVLQVHSALEGVGLTAAVAGALADCGIACNVVAALHHDHVFVPASRAHEALVLLRQAAEDASR